jgi:hypothetical protein
MTPRERIGADELGRCETAIAAYEDKIAKKARVGDKSAAGIPGDAPEEVDVEAAERKTEIAPPASSATSADPAPETTAASESGSSGESGGSSESAPAAARSDREETGWCCRCFFFCLLLCLILGVLLLLRLLGFLRDEYFLP